MFPRTAVALALVALSFAVARNAHADNNTIKAHLAIQPVCGQGAHLYDIRNVGTVTSSVLKYKVTVHAGANLPALKEWNLTLFPLASGQVFQLSVPREAWGFKVSVEIAAGAGTVVDAAAPVTYPSFCW